MTTNTPQLTDAALESLLARHVEPVSAAGLQDVIMAEVAATEQVRRPVFALPRWLARPGASLQFAWLLLLVTVVLLGLAASFLITGSSPRNLLRPAEMRGEGAWTVSEEATAPLLDLVAVSGDEAWGLWVGAWGNVVNEIWHFQGSVSSRESSAQGVPAGVRDLALAPDGTLWAATDHGVAARSNGRWAIIDPRSARGVAVGTDGTVWIGGGPNGPDAWTLRRDGAAWVAGEVPDSPLEGGGPSMTIDRGGNLWISGAGRGWVEPGGVFRFDGQRWDAMYPIVDVGDVRVASVVSAPDGDVWAIPTWVSNAWPDPATQVARFDGTRWTVFGTGDGLPTDNVSLSLAIGRDGTVWLSSPGGLCSFDGERWTVHFRGHYFGMVAVAPDGTLWASGEGGVVHIAPPSG